MEQVEEREEMGLRTRTRGPVASPKHVMISVLILKTTEFTK